MMARRIGVRVLTFSLGFGPKILSFRRGDTEYCVSAIPLGGYVKMAGESPEDARTGSSDEFLSKSKWQRFQVLVMGPVMNLALAVVVMAMVLLQGAKLPAFEDSRRRRRRILAETRLPQAAGVQLGDHIVVVDDKDVPTWKQFYMAIATRANRPVRLVIEREGKRIERQVVPVPVDRFETGAVGVLPVTHPQIDAVRKGQPGFEGGLRAGDIVMSAGGEAGLSRERLIELIQANEGKPLTLEVQRGDARPDRHGRAAGDRRAGTYRRDDNQRRAQDCRARARRSRQAEPATELGVDDAHLRDARRALHAPDVGQAADGPGRDRRMSRRGRAAGQLDSALHADGDDQPQPRAAQPHADSRCSTAATSRSSRSKGVSRRDFSMKVKEKMLLAGFVLLLMLMVTVIYNDLMRIQWIERLIPWR